MSGAQLRGRSWKLSYNMWVWIDFSIVSLYLESWELIFVFCCHRCTEVAPGSLQACASSTLNFPSTSRNFLIKSLLGMSPTQDKDETYLAHLEELSKSVTIHLSQKSNVLSSRHSQEGALERHSISFGNNRCFSGTETIQSCKYCVYEAVARNLYWTGSGVCTENISKTTCKCYYVITLRWVIIVGLSAVLRAAGFVQENPSTKKQVDWYDRGWFWNIKWRLFFIHNVMIECNIRFFNICDSYGIAKCGSKWM